MAGEDLERTPRNLGEKALDELSKLGMLGLLLAVPATAVWAARKLLRRSR